MILPKVMLPFGAGYTSWLSSVLRHFRPADDEMLLWKLTAFMQ